MRGPRLRKCSPLPPVSGVHRVPLHPTCNAAVYGGGSSVAQQLQQLGAASAISSAAVSSGAPFWQLVLAFLLGGAFFGTFLAVAFIFQGAAYAVGSNNIKRGRKLLSIVVRRIWKVTVTMLGAASMALWRRTIPGAPCVDAEECDVPRTRTRSTFKNPALSVLVRH